MAHRIYAKFGRAAIRTPGRLPRYPPRKKPRTYGSGHARRSLGHVLRWADGSLKAVPSKPSSAPRGTYILSRLYREGMLASLAPPGSPTVDVLVLTPDQSVVASLQVKTRTYGTDKGWHMSVKHESISEPRLLYAFVDLEPQPPVTYIVPSSVVADVIKKSYAAWLAAPGPVASRTTTRSSRRIQPVYKDKFPGYTANWLNEWRERWDLLAAAVASSTGAAVPK